MYKIRFIGGPLAGTTTKISELSSRIIRYLERGAEGIHYFLVSDPNKDLPEYKIQYKEKK